MISREKDIHYPADQCIKCTICVEHCPVVKVTDKFLGPKQVGPDFQRFRSEKDDPHDASVDYCTGCRICDVACPSGVNISELNIRAKIAVKEKEGIPIRDTLLSHAYMFGQLGSFAAPAANAFLRFRPFRWLSDKLLHLEKSVRYPFYQRESFEKWIKDYTFTSDRKVAYFYGCFTNYNDPSIGKSVVKVLQKNGIQVVFPEQECCGLPLLGNGNVREARKLARRNLAGLLSAVDDGLDIIYSSTSCGMMIRDDYVTYLDLPEAEPLFDHMKEISEYLWDLHEKKELNTDFTDVNMAMPYHAPCHLRSLGIGFPALDLMNLIPGLRVMDLGTYCCGLAGTYGFKSDKYEITKAIGAELAVLLKKIDGKYASSDCEACRMQIENLSTKKAVHPIIPLVWAYGIDLNEES
jgi:glycerol-3-phosphate dehydrogenase subunit C